MTGIFVKMAVSNMHIRCIKNILIPVTVVFHFSYMANAVDLNKKVNRIDTLPTLHLITFLQQMNVQSYYGLAVDSFLAAIPNNPSGMFVNSCKMDRQAMYKACYLQVSFTPDIVIRIYVTNYTYLTQYNPNLTWDVALFKQEIIHKISIYKDNICINGLCRN
jgi:hypothetical protein